MWRAGARSVLLTIGFLTILIVLPVAGVLWMTSVPGQSHEGPLPPLVGEEMQLAAKLQEHVGAVASKPHNV